MGTVLTLAQMYAMSDETRRVVFLANGAFVATAGADFQRGDLRVVERHAKLGSAQELARQVCDGLPVHLFGKSDQLRRKVREYADAKLPRTHAGITALAIDLITAIHTLDMELHMIATAAAPKEAQRKRSEAFRARAAARDRKGYRARLAFEAERSNVGSWSALAEEEHARLSDRRGARGPLFNFLVDVVGGIQGGSSRAKRYSSYLDGRTDSPACFLVLNDTGRMFLAVYAFSEFGASLTARG